MYCFFMFWINLHRERHIFHFLQLLPVLVGVHTFANVISIEEEFVVWVLFPCQRAQMLAISGSNLCPFCSVYRSSNVYCLVIDLCAENYCFFSCFSSIWERQTHILFFSAVTCSVHALPTWSFSRSSLLCNYFSMPTRSNACYAGSNSWPFCSV